MDKHPYSTLVIQSHRQPLPFPWLEQCLESVRIWCKQSDYEYRFYGDELFDPLDPVLIKKFSSQKVVLTDLARLLLIKSALEEGYDRVVWLDADMLVFVPQAFSLPALWNLPEGYMLGREVWVQHQSYQPSKRSGVQEWKAYVKVHNAFLLFDRGNSFLDFYTHHAERFLWQCDGAVPAQFIGPKLLTALHNVVQCPVMESAGMFSPDVIKDVLNLGSRGALACMRQRSKAPLAAVNLCGSLVESAELAEAEMHSLIEKLLSDGCCI